MLAAETAVSASMSVISDQTLELAVPGFGLISQSETSRVPERWMRKAGVDEDVRRRKPAMSALMEGSWAELPVSVQCSRIRHCHSGTTG